MKKLETTLVPERRAPLLRSLSARSLDQMEDALRAVQNARPRPEIILRWKRFGLLVVLSSVALAGLAITLHFGIPLMSVDPYDAESKVDLLNTYSGVIMGFLESVVGLLLGYLFPVFTVYLHNLKWYPNDDPANKPIGKLKKTALLLFFPIVMIATEEVYPNLIYKKRFRIGKTGEKIKFREFSVESVGLHHRMEEDEQIYL
ncbi:TPA: hypothetical protein N0F65_011937 [Lagenidium giganteum]|uniref:Photosystem I assembly protein Ycf4 n=1 Tax=Lagenidium giganteum TaxID=4803 RepID=A0AAV2Z9I3_9STRA|nr:TPA: hypothetical protein N0F65_011937 [Lagenidium giganteum]